MAHPPWGSEEGARWYDRSINWTARLEREIPVLVGLFGPPGPGGIIDMGCGTGHQASALAKQGYKVVGIDAGPAMLALAQETAARDGASVRLVESTYAAMHRAVGTGFDGLYCQGNSLAAAGSRQAVRTAIEQSSKCLRSGGKMLIQVLNFEKMRKEIPCVNGPRISKMDGREYVSVRQFHFMEDLVQVTNITLWSDNGWHQRAQSGTLYPVTESELRLWLAEQGVDCVAVWGDYTKTPFSIETSTDLVFVGQKR